MCIRDRLFIEPIKLKKIPLRVTQQRPKYANPRAKMSTFSKKMSINLIVMESSLQDIPLKMKKFSSEKY